MSSHQNNGSECLQLSSDFRHLFPPDTFTYNYDLYVGPDNGQITYFQRNILILGIPFPEPISILPCPSGGDDVTTKTIISLALHLQSTNSSSARQNTCQIMHLQNSHSPAPTRQARILNWHFKQSSSCLSHSLLNNQIEIRINQLIFYFLVLAIPVALAKFQATTYLTRYHLRLANKPIACVNT